MASIRATNVQNFICFCSARNHPSDFRHASCVLPCHQHDYADCSRTYNFDSINCALKVFSNAFCKASAASSKFILIEKSSNEDPQEEFNNEISKKLPAPITVHESLVNNIMD